MPHTGIPTCTYASDQSRYMFTVLAIGLASNYLRLCLDIRCLVLGLEAAV